MPTSPPPSRISVCLVAVPEVSAAVVYGLHETFSAVGTAWGALTGGLNGARRMEPRIVSACREPFRTLGGVTLAPDLTFAEAERADIVVVADLTLEHCADLAGRWPELVAWLSARHAGGAIVASVCTGSLMLAEAGLLDGREATSHWSAVTHFRSQYPQVELRPERILTASGEGHRIVTSGGSAAWADLALYLVARFCGEEEARRIAKIFLFGDRSAGQAPFAAMARPRQHDDAAIAEGWIAGNYTIREPVEAMARQAGLAARTFARRNYTSSGSRSSSIRQWRGRPRPLQAARRTFARRFRAATGYAPLDYVQTLRIEEAKQLLETSDTAIDAIAAEVGYEDPASFRRLFKRTTGITPHDYRRRFRRVSPA
jgi:transcriptional regulator GlxA family with amidase domain